MSDSPPDGCIVVVNAGSSSVKFAIYEASFDGVLLFRGQIEQLGLAPRLRMLDGGGRIVAEREWTKGMLDHGGAVRELLLLGRKLVGDRPVLGIGHRVVHGGTAFATPTRVNTRVMKALTKLVPLAPLHQPHNLAAIATVTEAAPRLPQVACFDTAFHRTQPALAQEFALPGKYTRDGVRRYGFHGLSYDYVVNRLKETMPVLSGARLVIAHLGSGASLCAVRDGKSIASTMGFSAIDGLMMGTRTGALDPGILLYLLQERGMSTEQIEDLLYRQSGLLGVSGISSDMRVLRQSTAPEAAHAIALFVYRIVREIGSLAAALGGLDGIVFTAGVGENDPATRSEVSTGCRWLGLTLDERRNTAGESRISTDTSNVSAWVVPTDEERMIARYTCQLLAGTP
ncbi:MAG: acetate/propionate family kinase [Enhydrobacter sp.]|nr:MAG: acetate/propionate family kinase [Enhydrobacter sp.]